MTVALHDVELLVDGLEKIRDLSNIEAVSKMYSQFQLARQPRAATINVLAQALYDVFSGKGDESLPDACFNYFKLGGPTISGPMSLLAGLNDSPSTLIAHFFAVALYGASGSLLPWKMPAGYRLVAAATKLVVPLLKAEGIFPDQFSIPKLPFAKL